MTAAVIPKNHAMPIAMIQSGLLRSFSTFGIESSFAAGEASGTTTGTIAAVSGLQTGAQVGRDELQAAADKLLQSGLFAHVRYNFQSRADGLVVTVEPNGSPGKRLTVHEHHIVSATPA